MKRLYFTVKQWKRFDEEKQEHMTTNYEVILTDFKTRNERIIAALRKFNTTNLDSSIAKFNKGVDEFSKSVESFHKEMNWGTRQDPAKLIWGKPKRFSI